VRKNLEEESMSPGHLFLTRETRDARKGPQGKGMGKKGESEHSKRGERLD